jgi:hypothetical protein
MTWMTWIVLGVFVLGACAREGDREEGGSCPALVTVRGVEYYADSRFGVPRDTGREIEGVKAASCGGSTGRVVTGYAIPGIPVETAIYAPEAYGAEFILIRDGRRLSKDHLEQLATFLNSSSSAAL